MPKLVDVKQIYSFTVLKAKKPSISASRAGSFVEAIKGESVLFICLFPGLWWQLTVLGVPWLEAAPLQPLPASVSHMVLYFAALMPLSLLS